METVMGRVVGQRNRPVADATISFVRATAPVPDIAMLTDDLGRFYLDDLLPGSYAIRVHYGGGRSQETSFRVPTDGQPLVVRLATD